MIKFDRLRPFPVIHSVSAIFSAIFWGVRVCSSLSDFDAVRASSFLLCECLPTPPRLDRTHKPNNEPPRISPHRLKAAGAIRIKFVFQIVKDQLSSSGCGVRKFQRAGNPRFFLNFSTYYLHKTTLSPLRRRPFQSTTRAVN